MPQPIILALDTSTQACSVAVNNRAGELFSCDRITPQSHANQLLEMIQTTLERAQIEIEKIDYLAYGSGPGAFTGLRIAAGVAQGLALGWDKPVISLSSLASTAKAAIKANSEQLSAFDCVQWVALVDARMNEVYWQTGEFDQQKNWQESMLEILPENDFMQRLQKILEVTSADASQEKALLICGDIFKEYPQAIDKIKESVSFGQNLFWQEALPSAAAMIELVNHQSLSANRVSECLPKPVYLRNHVADTIAERQAKRKK